MDTVQKVFGRLPVSTYDSKLPKVECTNPDLIVGLELEIEDIRFAINYNNEAWRLDRDGSLRPADYSYEFISLPMKMSGALAELKDIFEKNKFTIQKNYSDRTSVHVHTNVLDFTQEQVATLALVYTVMEHPLFEFINKFDAKDDYGYSRDTNIYCIPWTQCRMNGEFVGMLFSSPKHAVRTWQKYTALNLLPISTQGTVEWRHMHGTNNMEKLSKWLNIIGAIMKFSKETDFKEVEKTILTLNDTSAYHQFFDAVLQGTLVYDADYARQMANGVICAKYALINKDKRKADAKRNPVEWVDDEELDEDEPADARPDGWLEAAMRARIQGDAAQAMQQAEIAAAQMPAPGLAGWDIPFRAADPLGVAVERMRRAGVAAPARPAPANGRPANRRPVR